MVDDASSSSSSSNNTRQPLSSSSSPSFNKLLARTPSDVDFPGAFTTHPKTPAKNCAQTMKGSSMAEAVSGSLANVVGGVYNIVSYVNPLASSPGARAPQQPPVPDPTTRQEGDADDSGHSSGGGGDAACKMESPMQLQPPSAGTSVAADVDEQNLADANADNPENNRPPTPTKPSFTRMLRFPSHPVADSSGHAGSTEYKQAAQNDPVSRNVTQRTGQSFRPGAEEKRRYARRISKAPQLDALPPVDDDADADVLRPDSQQSSTYAVEHDGESDESEAPQHSDTDAPDLAVLDKAYQAAATTQRCDSKTHAVDSWRFISPRVKRVKRRVLWRLFLAQELAPAVYDEAADTAHIVTSPQSASSSKASSPVLAQAARGVSASPRSQPATLSHAATHARGDADASDAASLRRRMLESAAAAAPNAGPPRLRQRTPSMALSVDSHSSVAATVQAPAQRKHAVWTMEFSVCGKYLAAGGQDGVVRIWRVAPFARAQAREKLQQQCDTQAEPHTSSAGSGTLPLSASRRTRPTGAHSPISADSAGRVLQRPHARQASAAYVGSTGTAPFANTAPITRGRHRRSFSLTTTDTAPETPRTPADAAHAANPAPNASAAATDTAPPAHLHPMHAYELLEPVPFRSYVGHSADVLALSWSKNGFLLSASMDRTVRLWHPHRPECLCTFRHRDIVTSVAFSPRDDRLFISGSLDCRLRLWDIPARGVRQWTRLPDGQMVTSVAFTSPKGDHIVAGTYRGMCVFYSTADLAVQGRMHARSSRGRNARGSKITGFAFAPTGQLPAPLLQRLLGPHASDLFDEQRLLVSSNDSRLRLFLPAAREVERKYKGHANASSQAYARLSSDGRYIISGSEDHNIYVWPLAQDNAATAATHPNADHIRRVGRSGAVAVAPPSTDSASPVSSTRQLEKQPLLAALFGRKRNQQVHHEKPSPPQQQQNSDSAVATEREAWESLDGKVEEKSIYEFFPAHDAAVSQALFAPAATLQYLADHDDPILSRRKMRRTNEKGEVENVLSVSANAIFGGSDAPESTSTDDLAHTVEDMTAIIVSADTNGCIRVFRKDINVLQGQGVVDSQSQCSSQLKKKESLGPLARVLTRESKPTAEATGSLAEFSPATPQNAESGLPRSTTKGSGLSAGGQLAARPPPLSAQSHHQRQRSLWDRIGRRVSQKRQNSTFSGTSSGVSEEQLQRPRAVSGGAEAEPSLSVIAELPSSPSNAQSESNDVCVHCNHTKFIDFAVAPATKQGTAPDDASAPKQMNISVCENCKHVRNLPV
ncbi:hypothetical protein H4R24_002621 [Coemansia sp. RSA 988]|nr:hypothetical protein H4R24_002621 [Coemansia sp. RSA 988]